MAQILPDQRSPGLGGNELFDTFTLTFTGGVTGPIFVAPYSNMMIYNGTGDVVEEIAPEISFDGLSWFKVARESYVLSGNINADETAMLMFPIRDELRTLNHPPIPLRAPWIRFSWTAGDPGIKLVCFK